MRSWVKLPVVGSGLATLGSCVSSVTIASSGGLAHMYLVSPHDPSWITAAIMGLTCLFGSWFAIAVPAKIEELIEGL